MRPAPDRAPAGGQDRPPGGQQPGQRRHRAPHPALPGGAVSSQPGLPGLIELDELAEELNRRGFPSLRLTSPGELPYVDVSLPGSTTVGQRIYVQDGMFAWAIGAAGRPAATAAVIAGLLRASGRPRS